MVGQASSQIACPPEVEGVTLLRDHVDTGFPRRRRTVLVHANRGRIHQALKGCLNLLNLGGKPLAVATFRDTSLMHHLEYGTGG